MPINNTEVKAIGFVWKEDTTDYTWILPIKQTSDAINL
jgi:hypothetical protein